MIKYICLMVYSRREAQEVRTGWYCTTMSRRTDIINAQSQSPVIQAEGRDTKLHIKECQAHCCCYAVVQKYTVALFYVGPLQTHDASIKMRAANRQNLI